MKISKDRLKEIVAEEMSISFGGVGLEPEEHEGRESHDADGNMAKQNLWKMAQYAKELYELIGDDEDLEPWVEEKIAIASFMMDSVGHYMQYEKHRDHEGMEGEEDHFEMDSDEGEEYEDEEYEFDPDAEEESDEEYSDEEDEEDRY